MIGATEEKRFLICLLTKLLLRQLPDEKQTMPLEVIAMMIMDKYRVQEGQNGRIPLAAVDATVKPER